MKEPPGYLQPILHSIESAALSAKEEFPRLQDKDAEWVYSKLADYYKAVGRGKTAAEPTSTSEAKQAMIDDILNILDLRIEEGMDAHIAGNPDYTDNGRPYPSLGFLYAKCFKRLNDSATFWRKNREYGGYFGYIKQFM